MSIGLRTFSFVVLIAFCAQTRLSAQYHRILDGFSIHKIDDKVYLSWQIAAGNTCFGTIIHRSTDSLNYTRIGEIYGVCGSSSESVTYEFIDDAPVKNSVNYYVLELGHGDFSQFISVEIAGLSQEGYQIRPNPITDQAKLYFENDRKEECVLRVYNNQGHEVMSLTTSEDVFTLSSSQLKPGIYFFAISRSSGLNVLKGKFVVQP